MRKHKILGILIAVSIAVLMFANVFAFAQDDGMAPAPMSDHSWDTLSDPPLPNDLLAYHNLPNAQIQYSAPSTNGCSVAGGLGTVWDTCSDPKGFGKTLVSIQPAIQAMVLTGDDVDVFHLNGDNMFPKPEKSIWEKLMTAFFGVPTKAEVPSSVTVIVDVDNIGTAPAQLYIHPVRNHFRGWYSMRIDAPRTEYLLFNTVERFSSPVQSSENYAGDNGGATPVWNCSSPDGCSVFHVRLAVYFNGQWYTKVGLYDEGFLFPASYTTYTNQMPELVAAMDAAAAEATVEPTGIQVEPTVGPTLDPLATDAAGNSG